MGRAKHCTRPSRRSRHVTAHPYRRSITAGTSWKPTVTRSATSNTQDGNSLSTADEHKPQTRPGNESTPSCGNWGHQRVPAPDRCGYRRAQYPRRPAPASLVSANQPVIGKVSDLPCSSGAALGFRQPAPDGYGAYLSHRPHSCRRSLHRRILGRTGDARAGFLMPTSHL